MADYRDLLLTFSRESSVKILMLFNYLVALAIIALSCVNIILGGLNSAFELLATIYLILFTLLMIAAETSFKWILDYFGFMKRLSGRALFNIFVASLTMLLTMEEKDESQILRLFSYACATALVVLSIFYLYEEKKIEAGKGFTYQELIVKRVSHEEPAGEYVGLTNQA